MRKRQRLKNAKMIGWIEAVVVDEVAGEECHFRAKWGGKHVRDQKRFWHDVNSAMKERGIPESWIRLVDKNGQPTELL